jgi:hypothetical protein
MLTFLVSQLNDYDQDGNIIGHPDSVILHNYKSALFGERLINKKCAK